MAKRVNPILNTDSYKPSHWLQYPPGTEVVYSYIESRGGIFSETVFAGLQPFIKEYLSNPVTMEDVIEAEAIFMAHGEPFNKQGWVDMINEYGGYFPVRIRAVREGTVVPTGNVLVTVENTNPKFFWATSYIETPLLRAAWYMTSVATISWSIKQLIKQYLDETGDPDSIAFKLHDFGARGVSSFESSGLGGAAHLINFMGSDNLSGILVARDYYGEPMAGFSIPAAEHSSITSWGRDREVDAYRNMLTQFAKPGSMLAVVSDSYDIYNACKSWGTDLKQQLIDSKATVIIRPDSGVPVDTVAGRVYDVVPDLDDYTLLGATASVVRVDDKYYEIESYDTGWTTKFIIREIREEEVFGVIGTLAKYFGYTVNAKGYKVLNNVRIIQGDGINEQSIAEILARLKEFGWSADNVAFGMGGALLQHVNRDTQKFAMKASAALINGEWVDVFKDPITDTGKRSKKGRLALIRDESTGEFKTVPNPDDAESLLEIVWENGELKRDQTFAEIRALSNA